MTIKVSAIQSIVKIRPIVLDDLTRIIHLEQGATPYPWSEQQHRDSINSSYPSLGVTIDNELVAFAIFAPQYDECHLMNLVTSVDHQGKGYAKKLLNAMEGWALQQGVGDSENIKIASYWLEVRASNESAIGLYQTVNYEVVGRRKNYYPCKPKEDLTTREDAIIMSKVVNAFPR